MATNRSYDVLPREATDVARGIVEAHKELAARAAVGQQAVARAAAFGHDAGVRSGSPLPDPPVRVRWGWRKARLSVGPWCWIGADNKLRAHEGNLRLVPKVVMGSDNGGEGMILRGADIGTGSAVGSQALVKSAIPPFSIVVGTPARVIKSRLLAGMTVGEGLALQRPGHPIPGDPLDA